MAFIHNIKTNISTECTNKDVVKICKKDPLNYIVCDSLSELNEQIKVLNIVDAPDGLKEPSKSISKMKVDELKTLATELGIENTDSLTRDELIAVIKEKKNG